MLHVSFKPHNATFYFTKLQLRICAALVKKNPPLANVAIFFKKKKYQSNISIVNNSLTHNKKTGI